MKKRQKKKREREGERERRCGGVERERGREGG